ncbi:MAG: hypothetical protein FJ004_00550 [Chloroflexi bacterium]|nr:hypothetical protein [Chloroflexota bacterium]
MFPPAHMAVGALCQAGIRRKLPTAAVAFASTAIVDSTNMWHAPYPWPSDSPAILRFLPYPHDVPSILTLVALVVATIAVGFLLRHYWWGMVWALAPDIIDWLILRPIVGKGVIHEWLSWVTTPWGFAIEMAFVVVIVVVLLGRQKKRMRASSEYHS